MLACVRLLTLAVLVALSTAASAATRYVDPAGSDAGNDCLGAGTPCATIQHAVDEAADGDTIEVAAGTYDEQVAITKNDITVNGNGAAVKPTTVTPGLEQGNPCPGAAGLGTAIVLVSGATNVTLNDLTVDGLPAGAASPPRYFGIYYRDASGAINGGEVRDVRYDPFSGVQTGNGIYVQATLGNAPNVDITGVTVTGYQKNGITVNGCGCANTPQGTPTGTISGCTVTGVGPTAVTAQNGIQVGFGAGPVTISDNVVTDQYYTGDPANGTATGILLFSTLNNVVDMNEMADSNGGIVVEGGAFGLCLPGDSTGNTATCNDVTGNDVGVYTDALLTAANMNSITGNTLGADGSAIVAGTLDATENWWGCAAGPGNPGCDPIGANVDASSPLAGAPGCVTGATSTTSSTVPTTTSSSSTSSSVPTTSSTSTTSTTLPGCPTTPSLDCQPAPSGKGVLRITNTVDARDRVAWVWKSTDVTEKADFGTPTTSTDVAFCVYEETGGPPALRVGALAPANGTCAGRPCWKEIGKGFRYRDRELTPGGLKALVLKAGPIGRARIRARGKGANLGLGAELPLTPPLKVQVQRLDGTECWEATFSLPKRNDGRRFVARSD